MALDDRHRQAPPPDGAALRSALAAALSPQAVVDGPLLPWAIDDQVPLAVVQPSSADEVAATLATAQQLGATVYVRGAGTQLALGRPPVRVDVVLDTRRLSQILDLQPADLTVTVQAGVSLAHLQAALAEHGQFLPIDPPVPPEATVGGLIATRASGPLRFGFGTLRDVLIGLKVVQPDGQITRAGGRVVKNVAGYELCKLHTGAFGTLGVIVEATFKVRPRPEAVGLLALPLADQQHAEAALAALLDSDAEPQLVELLNGQAIAGQPDLAADLLPLARGEARFWLLVGCAGSTPSVTWQIQRASQVLAESGAGDQPATVDWQRVYPALLAAWRPLAPRPGHLSVEATLLSSEVARFMADAEAVAASHGLQVHLLAHAGNGVVVGHLRPAEGTSWPEAVAEERLASAHEALLSLATRPPAGSEGVPTDPGPGNPGQLPAAMLGQLGAGQLCIVSASAALRRRLPVWGRPRSDTALMAALRARLDPGEVLNRGRFVV